MESIWPVLGGLILLAAFLGFWEWFRNTETRIRVSSWGDLQENRILIDFINDFRLKNPSIQVSLERIPFGGYRTEVLHQISRGSGPDVLFVEVGNFPDFYFQDALEPLDPYLEAERLDLSAYYPELLERFTFGRRTYVLPRDIAPCCAVYYNKKAFDEADIPYPTDDWSWEQFVETMKKAAKSEAGGRVARWGLVEDWPMLDPWVYAAGGSYVDDLRLPTRWTFASDPNSLKGVQLRADLILKYKVLPPHSFAASLSDVQTADLFVHGEAALYLSGLFRTPRFREIRGFGWDVAMFPPGPQGHRVFASGGSGYGILKTSKNKKAAWKFVYFISSADAARKLAATGLAQPALKAVAASHAFLDDQPPRNKKMLLDAVKQVKFSPICRNWWETQAIIHGELEPVWRGARSVEDAMARLKPLLEKNPPLTH